MKKVELLAPAGSMEALYAAVQNGCDAVYLGGEMFGARAFAQNFTREDLKEALHYAHMYGVNVYITVNTLIKEDEMAAAIDYISFLQDIDVDALIIQDLGLLSVVREMFPDMEVHASTQMHVHNPDGILCLKEQGVKRVVVPRETTIEEIQEYAKLGVDLEVFVQGALCVSYSGQCLMSSVLFDRSGNRGACAQPCRMQYGLYRKENQQLIPVKSKGDYLLSPKDLNTLQQLPALIDAGVVSFKIEGRMKRPEYVACMVSLYRQAIDAHLAHRKFQVRADMLEDMQKLFHRGFTSGHIFHQKGSALMNPIRPNHMGVEIGKIIGIKKDKMRVKLSKELDQGDGIRILGDEDEGFRVNKIYKNGLLVNHGEAGDIIELDRIYGVKEHASILKTSAIHQLKQLQDSYQGYQRRVCIQAEFHMKKEHQPILMVSDQQGNQVQITGSCMVEKALKTPLSKERLEAQLMKTKDTPYTFEDIQIQMDDDAIMPIKEINQMRRDALAALSEKRAIHHANRRKLTCKDVLINVSQKKECSVILHTYEQYQACKDQDVVIYVDAKSLYEKLKEEDANIKFITPRIMKGKYPQSGMIQDIGGLYQKKAYTYGTSLNVSNSYSAQFLFQQKAESVIFSLETDKEECMHIMAQAKQRYHGGSFGYVVYGKRELMISEYCPINAVEKDSDKQNCGLCRKHDYVLIDKKKRQFPLMMDENCRMHLLEEMPWNRLEDIQDLKKAGLHHFVCVLNDEDEKDSRKIIQQVVSLCQ